MKDDLVARVQAIFDYDVNPNALNEDGDTLLHSAIRAQSEDIIDLVLNIPGVNISTCNREGVTPLILAIKLGYRKIAQKIYSFTCSTIAEFNVPSNAITIHYKTNLGGGRFGSVYKATLYNEEVAVKIPHRGNEREILKEIEIMQKCRSPYIVDLKAISIQNDSPKLALQYMDCGDLRRYHEDKRMGRPTQIQVTSFEVAWVVANALVDLHAQNALHRDIKSSNILLSTNHYIKVGDLGISRDIISDTMTGVVGTLCWTAPEVIRSERYNFAADIYSFGVVLAELDAKNEPYLNLTKGMDLFGKIARGTIKPSLSSTCEPWLKNLAEMCLSFNPQQRPSAQTVVDILQARFAQSTRDDNRVQRSNSTPVPSTFQNQPAVYLLVKHCF
ncbi:kinase [Thraustotheca clavata]|uniref:Kinase n=1 Tax=Thraustotheca clavata TaxID=74557 RepID=A0A1V9Y6Z5_9STRA|nr:kinase [Thraustotheca clavata]